MKATLSKRILSMLLAIAMVLGFAVPVGAAGHNHSQNAGISFRETDALVDLPMIGQAQPLTEQIPEYADTDIVRVSIVLDKDSTLQAGFSTMDIAGNAQAMSYREELKAEQTAVTARIEKALGAELEVQWNLTLAANLISAYVAYGDIAAVEAVEGVAQVIVENRYETCVVDRETEYNPNMQSSTHQVGVRTVWANGYTGAGSRVAVIDTGIDVDHQSFSAKGLEYALKLNAEKEGKELDAYLAELDLLDKEEILAVADQLNIPDVNADRAYYSTKIPFGYNYIDVNYKYTHDYDEQGEHGSHVCGIAAANRYIPQRDGSFLDAVDTVGVAGVAPDAQLIAMKVFGAGGGAYDSDYMAAIEDAIVLGCDSVNLSLGSGSAGFSFNATYQELLNDLQKSDIVATMSAGNSYGWDYEIEPSYLYVEDIRFHTGGSPGSYSNSLGVASVESMTYGEDGELEVTEYQEMSDFSSWGVPDSLEMKPEITAPGGNIYSVNGMVAGGKSYEVMSGTSMAAPQMAGAAAVMAEYIRDNNLVEKTGLTIRQLSQSLMMSTAMPLMEEGDNYYSVLKQGSGLVQVDAATGADTYILMGEDATAYAADGKVKAELGDDPQRTGVYTFSFTINNFSDEENTYRLATRLFTQDSNGKWLYPETTPLMTNVSYKIDGATYLPEVVGVECDLNADGVTDAADAQIILNYVAGLTAEIAPIADVDVNGTVDTYDAHLLLAGLQTGEFTIPAGTSVEVVLTAELTAEQKAELDDTYPNGAYVEGYVFVNPSSDAEGIACDSVHSIPVLGFYGNWTDPSMFGVTYRDQVYGDAREAYCGENDNNNLVVNRDGESFFQIGNPYGIEDADPVGRDAVRGNDILESYRSMLIRNANAYVTLIRDEEGNVLYRSGSANVHGAYYYVNGSEWRNTNSSVNLGFTAESLGLEENDRFTVTLVAVPEYYMLGESISIDRVLEILDSGVMGEGATLTTELVVDNTAPELIAVSKDINNENLLVVNAKDNQNVAVMALVSMDGKTTYASAMPAEPGASVFTMDLTGVKAGKTCLLMLGDYAGNERTYEVTLNLEEPGEGGGGTTPGTPGGQGGSLYAFSQAYGGWTSIDVASASIADKGHGNLNIMAAEYVDGYAYMVSSDGYLYVAPHGNWNAAVKLADVAAYGIEDMAFSYVTKKLYALGANNTIYTVDFNTGALTKEFTVSIINTKDASCTKLQGLGINENGEFYAVCHGGDGYEFAAQSYKFTLDMVVDGAIVDLEPLKREYSWGTVNWSYLGGYTDNGQKLAWDFENDKMLYYSWGRYDIDTVGYLTETGGINSANSGLKIQMSGMYFEGSKVGVIENATEVESFTVSTNELKMMPGATATIGTTITPWTLADQSLTWVCADTDVAIVNNGKVTAVNPGSTTITVTTNAAPYLQQVINVTVNELPDTDLFAYLQDEDGNPLWVKFNSNAPEAWEIVAESDGVVTYGGVLLKDTVYVHDGADIYAMDPDLFTMQRVTGVGSYFAWADAAGAEGVDGYFDRIVSACNVGAGVAVINPYDATVVEFDASGVLGNDALVTMSVAGLSYVTVGENENCPAYTFYSLAESGNIYEIVLAAYPGETGEDYDFSIRKVSSTTIKPTGAAEVGGDSYASAIYDAESGCLVVVVYVSGDSTARVYAVEPTGGAALELGGVRDEVWPAYSMYQYTPPTDLTLRVRPERLSMFKGDEETITAFSVPTNFVGGVTFASSDENVVTVDENGLVLAVAPGDCVITVTTVDVNAAGETISKEIPVHVEDVLDIDLTINAKLELEEDGSNWVSIDTTDVKNPEIINYDHAYLYGGAVHDNVIYGGDNKVYIDWNYWAVVSNLYIVEPEYGYDITPGGIVSYQQAPSDMTTMPALELSYTDADGNPATIIAGDMPIYIDFAEELIMWNGEPNAEVADLIGWVLTDEFDGTMGALAFMGMTEVNGQDAWSYAGLTNSGNLYNLVITAKVVFNEETGAYEADYSCDYSYVGNVGLTFGSADEMSMIYVNDGAHTGLVIAYYEDVAELYYVGISMDMLEVKLTSGKIGSIPGASRITAMYLPEELQVNAAAPNLFRGEIEAMETNVVSGPDRTMTYQAKLSDDLLTIGGAPKAEVKPDSTFVPGDGTIAIELTEEVAASNGILEVSYDPAVLTYVSTTSTNLVAVNASEGKVLVAYASGRELPAGSALATVNFTFAGEYIETTVTVKTLQRNTDTTVTEEDEIIDIACEVGDHKYEVTEKVEPDCLNAGYQIWTCTKCGESYREELPATGHSYEAVVTEPTCTEMGYTTYTCACGDTYKDNYVNPTGHQYEKTVTPPTCTEHGYT
ncbi:MAG: hypothetical protein E7459_01260, partial [Ruminococcaceae bacterium]|nr:hypothetical protein [Oscillospiraceae bacterium]